MKKILLALLLVTTPAYAQANSCDKIVLTGTILVSNPTFQFSIGLPSGSQVPDGFTYTDNGTKSDIAAFTPSGTAVNGQACYDVSITIVGNGNHTITTNWYTLNGTQRQETLTPSDPFVLSLGKPPASGKPINHPR